MMHRAIVGSFAVIAALASLAAHTPAAAQGAPIRDLQYTNYLKENDFNGDAVAAACKSSTFPGIAFQSSADEKNLTAFLEFLKIRPQDVKFFNDGQFSQTAAAVGDAIADVCGAIAGESDDADALFKPPTSFDPLIDDINLSDFMFEYRFRHDQPQGFLPLSRRATPVLLLDVDFDADNFPDEAGNVWEYQTAELIVTIVNYEYFRQPESGVPGAIRQEDGSYPCYYTDPRFNGVYRYALQDCNPETPAEYTPQGKSLRAAVREAVINYIEQNIDSAGPPVKVDNPLAEICCMTRHPGAGNHFFMTVFDQCFAPDGSDGEVVPARFCGVDNDVGIEILDEAPSDGEIDIGGPGQQSRASVCCQDYSGISPENFWEDRRLCEDRDDHAVVADALCRR